MVRTLRAWLYLLALLPVAYGVASNVQNLTAKGKDIEVSAVVAPALIKFREGESKIEGKISVKNQGTKPMHYSNRNLILKLNDKLNARAYLDSVASNIVDFGSVEIPGGSSLTLNVYWVFPLDPKMPVENLRLELNEKALE